MPKLPVLSGAEMVKILERKGYTQVRTRGSHVRLYPPDFLPQAKKVTVPLHKQLTPGTLSNIMRDAGLTAGDLG
ncbi:MAG: type II toxin-antitoxin system HicA family toxin [Patescibacteria group bacterium]|nr:type II toxin-antitoxin system HicA family toxin [Patescibacteria group bacterium]MDE1945228.1 type II toxin-antitoxin system HicA family toxin [Patescibacteria group bacterium]MDE2057975.1 type II toxin-antitoxin system HicA family toxin [Patescibacteria group bacterium]